MTRLTLRQWARLLAIGAGFALAGFSLPYFAAFVISKHVWS